MSNEYKDNFSFAQMVTNTKTHKTSATGVVGVLFCLVGLVLFVGSIICYFLSIGESSLLMSLLDKILLLIGAGSCLLGVRKMQGANKITDDNGEKN